MDAPSAEQTTELPATTSAESPAPIAWRARAAPGRRSSASRVAGVLLSGLLRVGAVVGAVVIVVAVGLVARMGAVTPEHDAASDVAAAPIVLTGGREVGARGGSGSAAGAAGRSSQRAAVPTAGGAGATAGGDSSDSGARGEAGSGGRAAASSNASSGRDGAATRQTSGAGGAGGGGNAESGGPLPAANPASRIDRAWAARVAGVTGIPLRAVLSYAAADLDLDAEQPGCGIAWNTIAAIGAVESGHGSHGASRLGWDGEVTPTVLGPVLNGHGFAAVADTDGGALDGDSRWDRAVGPMQFIPSTWRRWAADGSGDGVADVNQLDDASLATARYLCASGAMTGADGWRQAILSYNHSDQYADRIANVANRYAAAAKPVTP